MDRRNDQKTEMIEAIEVEQPQAKTVRERNVRAKVTGGNTTMGTGGARVPLLEEQILHSTAAEGGGQLAGGRVEALQQGL